MSETYVVAQNEDAEKLWNYLVSYRNRMGEKLMESTLTIEPIPLEENITLNAEN